MGVQDYGTYNHNIISYHDELVPDPYIGQYKVAKLLSGQCLLIEVIYILLSYT